jgi:hypothetical protein|nr:MAG TPA: hypothetical protein [Bacteriophage sp.]
MSSYILSIESITDIAESIRYILDNSSNSNCISLNTKELKNQFRNCDGKSGFYQTRKIARVLYRFNDLAVSSRYNESTTEIPDFSNDGKNLYMLDRYRFIKKLECYLYQCDEQATCATALYKALNDLLYSVYRAEIHKSDNYKNVEEWG